MAVFERGDIVIVDLEQVVGNKISKPFQHWC